MFRRGGSTGGGITSGLSRQGYREAGDVQPRRPSSNLNNFLIDFGLNLVGNPPSGNIFQTAAKQAQEPFSRFQARDVAQQDREWEQGLHKEKMDFQKEQFKEQQSQFKQELKQDWEIAELEAQGEKQFIKEQINNYWDKKIADAPVSEHADMEAKRNKDIYDIVIHGADISDKFKILNNAKALEIADTNAYNEIRNTINDGSFTGSKATGLVWAESDPGYNEFYQSLVNKYMRLATLFLEEGEELDASGGRVGRALGGGMTEDVNVMTETPGGISDINVSETVHKIY